MLCLYISYYIVFLCVFTIYNVTYFPSLFFLQLHTSELNDGYDWGRLNLQSVTEQSSLDDFLATAELAGTEFVAGRFTSLKPQMTSLRCWMNHMSLTAVVC